MSVFSLTDQHIAKLVELSSELKDLGSSLAILSWDQETYLTAKGAVARSRQLETLSGIYHQYATANKLGNLISTLTEKIDQNPTFYNEFDKALVREMKRDFELASKLPEKLVREISKESSLGLEAWKHARRQENFSLYSPSLARMIELKKEVAETLGYSESPYDALLNEFEEGLTKKQVMEIFGLLKPSLEKLIPKLRNKTKKFDHKLFSQDFDKDKLWDLSLSILEKIGFDLERGRQDQSTHPFTMGLNVNDVRLTTRLIPSNPISTLMSSIHEGGHGMYEQGILPEITYTTIGSVNSLVVHESQSRFWENMIGKSQAFWQYFFSEFQATFPKQLSKSNWKEAWEEINLVRPSLIRVDADEVTYHMHIIIRTEIESELIEGKLKPSEVPERWNEAYRQYLQIEVGSNALGCLQDIHWSQGLIGYFPTYSLGSLFAAQLFSQLEKEQPDISSSVKQGKFEQPLHWLNEKIHQHGRLYSSEQLCQRITGKSISSEDFVKHINSKFS